MPSPAGSLLAYLAQVPEPRGRKGRRHPLVAMLATIVCAMLCQARGPRAVAQWLHGLPVDVWHLLGYTRRPPKWGAFRKLLLKLDALAFEQAVADWLNSLLEPGLSPDKVSAVSIDGKTLRGSFDRHRGTFHLLTAFDQATGCIFHQWAVPQGSNEEKTVLEFLKQFVLRGRVVTLDAAFCHQEVCEAVTEREGHFLIVVKENQPTLHNAIASEFAAVPAAFSPLHRAGTAG